MTTLRAFHNEPGLKEMYLARVLVHRQADELVQGTGWEDGKGCAVGCTLEEYEHDRYPDELGVSEALAYLEDKLFELQPRADAMLWPERFLDAIPVGADLSGVWPKWAHWMLVDPTHGVIKHAGDRQDVRNAIQRVADLYLRGGTRAEFRAASHGWPSVSPVTLAATSAAMAWPPRPQAPHAANACAAAAWASEAPSAWTKAACDKLIELLAAAPGV